MRLVQTLVLLLTHQEATQAFVVPPPTAKRRPFVARQQQQQKQAVLSASLLPSMDTSNLKQVLDNIHLPTTTTTTELFSQTNFAGMLDKIQNLDAVIALSNQIQDFVHTFIEQHPSIQPYYEQAQALFSKVTADTLDASIPPEVILIGTTIASYLVVSTLLQQSKEPPPLEPYPMGTYNATSAKAYFDSRLPQVLWRGFEVTVLSLSFGINILSDYLSKTLEDNAETRAVELAQLLTKLGPSFIKIGQSLSIRTDLLSPPYVRGLATLQDQVPPFDSKVAFQMMEEEWGVAVDSVLDNISQEPVAAASLGQVYKATMKNNKNNNKQQEVAIKVQRPNIKNQIALDMHLLRTMAPLAKTALDLNTDLVGTVDAWGTGFVNELNYLEEAENAKQFDASIKMTPLKNVVLAPPVVDELTTGRVLTTEWIDGERLDQSSKGDITILCSIAMNTYLTMMLETGLLHCDPHPGNLLRTKDGQLCILDWGMVTRLEPELQITLIEHMAHLTSADYEQVPNDLLVLGFIPPSKAEYIRDSGVVETLADIYGAWTKGGGAATINVNKVISQLQDLTATRGNLFQIPPYFAYIAKSFSVLEGIGLSNNAQYSIINECLPYVSKRLLTDQSERTGGALKTFIFGPEKDSEQRIIDYDSVERLVTGFGNYTTSASGALLGFNDTSSKIDLLDNAADQILDLLLVEEEETPLQSIWLEQTAKIISSTSRSLWTELRQRSGTLPSGRTVLGTLVDPLGLWRTSPVVQMNELDTKTVETTRNLIALLQRQVNERGGGQDSAFDLSSLTREEVLELSSILVRKLWERRSGVLTTSNKLTGQLLKLTADKLERGEREVLTIPTNENNPPSTEMTLPEQQASVRRENDNSKAFVKRTNDKAPSARLQTARRILQEIESDTSSWSMPEEEAQMMEHEASRSELDPSPSYGMEHSVSSSTSSMSKEPVQPGPMKVDNLN